MHRRRYNSVSLNLTIAPQLPLLIQSGDISLNPTLPDMQFVRTSFGNEGEIIYIPGSSLKGVIRNYVERSLRTIKGDGIEGACDPLSKEHSCVKEMEGGKLPSYEIYRQSCRACRIFGNTCLKGRISFQDAYPQDEVRTETRHGIAISRLSQAVAQGPFDVEVAISASFKTKIFLENFEAWQIGLLALSLRDINKGRLKIGFGKNRGFGEVEVKVEEAEFAFAKKSPVNEIWGIGKMFSSEEERHYYGLSERDGFTVEAEPTKEAEEIYEIRRIYDFAGWEKIKEASLQHLKKVMQ